MKPHPRIRKAIKWGSAAVTVLLIAAFIPRGCAESVTTPETWPEPFAGWRLDIRARRACLMWHCRGAILRSQVPAVYTNPPSLCEWPLGFESSFSSPCYCVVTPLWLPIMCIGAVTGLVWRRDVVIRRRQSAIAHNLCPKCNYDLAGIAADAKCPECGAVPSRVGGSPAVGP
jgi:hypothetical protein